MLNALNIEYLNSAHHWHFQLLSLKPFHWKYYQVSLNPTNLCFFPWNQRVSRGIYPNIFSAREQSPEELGPKALNISHNLEKLYQKAVTNANTIYQLAWESVWRRRRTGWPIRRRDRLTCWHWSALGWMREDIWLSSPVQENERNCWQREESWAWKSSKGHQSFSRTLRFSGSQRKLKSDELQNFMSLWGHFSRKL